MKTDFENRRKMISGGIAVLFHVLVLLLLLLLGLPYQDPPPPEHGVEISAGELTDIGNAMSGEVGGGVEQDNNKVSENNEESYATQNTAESPISASSRKKKPKVEKPSKPAVEKDALFPGKKTNTGKNGGSTGGNGNGDGNGGGGTGVGSGGGGYSLNGRSAKFLPKPKTNKVETGNVVVDIKVDQDGNVREAHGGAKGTTIMDSNLWRICEQAAKRAKFSSKENAPELQRGTITYHFIN